MFQEYAKLVGVVGFASSTIFWAGQKSQKIDDLVAKSEENERERHGMQEVLFDMYGRVKSIEKDVGHLIKSVKVN